MSKSKSVLAEQAQTSVAIELQSTLVELIDLSLKGKQAHWNLVGSNFRSVHQYLDEMVEQFRDLSDKVAERCVTIGVAPDGLAATIASNSRLQALPHGRIDDRQVLELMGDCIAETCTRLRKRVMAIAESDPVSQNLLIEALGVLEKQLWMIQSQRQ